MSIEFISATRFTSNESVKIMVLVRDANGAPSNAKTPSITIQKGEDLWWRGAAYGAGAHAANMTETDSVNFLGVFEYTHSGLSSTDVAQLTIKVRTPDPNEELSYQSVSLSPSVADTPVPDVGFGADEDITTLSQLLSVLKLTQAGDQQLNDLTKELLFYKNDGINVGLRFDLTDASGSASAREVFKKVRS